jgi:integrative and conjugative element protein (TIGR02256 family)
MEAEADRYFPLETGGVLVGYRAQAVQVITNMIGPGPRAVRTTTSFEGDHEYQCEELERIYRRSGAVTMYLGDWHTHPSGIPQPSALDKETLRHIAAHRPADCKRPIMLIGGGAPHTWLWKAHIFDSSRTLHKIYSPTLIPYETQSKESS